MDLPVIIDRMLAPLRRRVRLMVARAVVSLVNDGGGLQLLQVKLLAGEVRDDVERLQNYGFTSVPLPGAEAVMVCVSGDRDHGLVVAVDDRRCRFKGLAPGEAAIYDDQGQSVHLTRDGIVVTGGGRPVIITGTEVVRVEAGRLECTGEVVDFCDSPAAASMASMRATYNGHTHPGDSGGVTGVPNQEM